MTRLIVARHGNTFAPDQTPRWVGARTDMPLVEKGLAQAQSLARHLGAAEIIPDIIITGPLLRTKTTAEIVAATLNLSTHKIKIDPRLTEIDYGAWEGKSTAEIIAQGDDAALQAWDAHSVFPADAHWHPAPAIIAENIAAILSQATAPVTLVITSNGILRFFAAAAINAAEYPDRKVATGNLCVMVREATGWRIEKWNQPPEHLATKEK